jgi:tetratricopeptide (TPR) repeat protein
MKNDNYLKQEKLYNQILKYEPGDFFAMNCLIDILEKLGDKTQAKEYKSKLAILKNEWIANFKTTENGERLNKRFKKITNRQIYCGEGQLKSWSALWSDLIRGADIDSVDFHFYRSKETESDHCTSTYLQIAELIDENGDKLNELRFDSALSRGDIDESLDLCLVILESNLQHVEARQFLAKYAFHNLGDFSIEQTLQQFEELYKDRGWSDPEILLYSGMIYVCIGEIQKALRMLKKLKKIERRSSRRNTILKDIPGTELPSKILEKFIAGIIKETESNNIN